MEAGGCVDEHGTACGLPTNCSACEGLCYDRAWAGDGRKCDKLPANSTLGPCDDGCPCVPPPASYDAAPQARPRRCHFGEPFGSCDGQLMPTSDKDRGKDYNHATYIDLVVAGLVGVRADQRRARRAAVGRSRRDRVRSARSTTSSTTGATSSQTDPDGEGDRAIAGCAGLCVFVGGAIAARARDALDRCSRCEQLERPHRHHGRAKDIEKSRALSGRFGNGP